MNGVVKITLKHENWPRLLSQISDPPKQLYCQGNLSLLNSSCFAVVGTRKITAYGRETTETLTRDLSAHGFTIISGLALGTDSVAHRTTIENGGRTIAVLGSGMNKEVLYPQDNIKLANDILKQNGLLISEYPPDAKAELWNFPKRNRIISGLSQGVLVIEADVESGALITAKCALDQNRDVFAVPGSILSPKSAGPNTLIQKGAKLVMGACDIIDEYGENLKLFPGSKTKVKLRDSTEEKIIDLLNEHGVMFIDDIIRSSSIEASTISVSLSMLEIRGLIKHLGHGKYRKV